MSKLCYDQNVPPSGPETPIVRVKTSGEHHFRILSRSYYGLWIHWNGQRSEGCFEDRQECSGCKRGLPRRWKGYLHCLAAERNGADCFLELTPVAITSLLAQCPKGESLRGLRLNVRRTSGGEKGRLRVLVLGDINPGKGLIEEKDPYNTLRKLWGLPAA